MLSEPAISNWTLFYEQTGGERSCIEDPGSKAVMLPDRANVASSTHFQSEFASIHSGPYPELMTAHVVADRVNCCTFTFAFLPFPVFPAMHCFVTMSGPTKFSGGSKQIQKYRQPSLYLKYIK